MESIWQFLTRSRTIWIALIATVGLMVAFALTRPLAGGVLLDGIADGAEAIRLADGLSADQRSAHFWITLVLDIPFPFAYAALFAGVILKGFPQAGRWLALIPALTIAADLAENTVQMIGLSGDTTILAAKSLLTPAKLWLFYASFLLTLASLAWMVVQRLRG